MFFIHISLPSLLIISGFILLFPTSATLALMGAVCVHEAGHLLAILATGGRVDGITVTPFGLMIARREQVCSAKSDLAILLAGPFANLIAGLLFFRHPLPGLSAFAADNLSFCLMNLLPVRPLDGGRALEIALSFRHPIVAGMAVKHLSFAVLLILWVVSVGLMLDGSGGLSLFAFCVWLFFAVFLKKTS